MCNSHKRGHHPQVEDHLCAVASIPTKFSSARSIVLIMVMVAGDGTFKRLGLRKGNWSFGRWGTLYLRSNSLVQ